MAAVNEIGRSGVVKDGTTGEMFLPESRRADGSIRKARRVKAGYVPQEEVPTYENKGVQWLKSKSDLPVGLSPDLMLKAKAAKDAASRGEDTSSLESGNKKKGKKKGEATSNKTSAQDSGQPKQAGNKKGQKKLTEDNDAVGDLLASVYGIKISDESVQKVGDQCGIDVDPSKRLKNLQKKLKSTDKLAEKIENGELKHPSQQELDKVARRSELEAEIKSFQNQLEKS